MSTSSSIPAKRNKSNTCIDSDSGSKRARITDSAPSNSSGKTATSRKKANGLLHEGDASYEDAIRSALQDRYLKNTSWKKLTEQYKVARSTIRKRYQGGKNRSVGHEAQAHLNLDEEQVLVEYCKSQALLAQPLSTLAVQKHVWEISGKKPGEDWVRRFFRRHKDIERISARGLSRQTVLDFFKLVKETVIDKKIPPGNIYNFDEKGIQLGGGCNNIRSKYIFPAGDKTRYLKKGDNLTMITILECVSATGNACSPMFILPKGKVPEWSHIPGVAAICTSENGWTDDSIGSWQWFQLVFIPWAKQFSDPAYPVVLFSDGHGSHVTSEMKTIALDNNVTLISLPPHTTYKLQPLDVGIFAPLQHAWGRECNGLALTGNEVTRDTVIEMYMKVRRHYVKPETIQAAWRHCGLHPFNPDIFTDADYAPFPFFSSRTANSLSDKAHHDLMHSSDEACFTTPPQTSDDSYRPTEASQHSESNDFFQDVTQNAEMNTGQTGLHHPHIVDLTFSHLPLLPH